MKTFFKVSLAILAVLSVASAKAWNYTNGDVLLIFRLSGFNDVEYDIGNISQFTALPSGSTISVSGWNRGVVTGVFGSDLTGVSVIVASTTADSSGSPSSWLSSGDSTATPHDYSFPTWRNNLFSTISAVGTRPLTYLVSSNSPAAYSIDPGGTFRLASYDYTVTGGGINSGAIQELGGNVSFNVEQAIPGSFGFWQIAPGSSTQTGTYVGTFTIDASGNLSFTAGPLSVVSPPTILSIGRTNTVNTVTFTTVAGGNYWLTYSNALSGANTNWPTVSGPISGDGSNHSLNHTTTDSSGFYRVVRTP